MDDVFVVRTTDLRKSDYVVLALFNFLVFVECTCNSLSNVPL